MISALNTHLIFDIVTATLVVGVVQGIEPASQYYRELGCKEPESGKSQAYNCSILDSLTSEKCFYNNKTYDVNESLRGEDIGSPCMHECVCQKSYITNRANWQCVDIECPELFNPPKENCISLYEAGSCCSVRTYCPKEEETSPVTCEYKGKKYVEGQKFEVDDSCKECVCKKGFNGTLVEPFCSNITCDFYLHYSSYIQDGCLPTYYETNDCCPIPIWRCPGEEDTVITQKTAPKDPSAPKCRFGSLELNMGEMLSPSEGNKCVECSCIAPPHPTCVMNTTCYNSHR